MPSPAEQRMRLSIANLPRQTEDLDPRNLRLLDQEMRHPQSQDPRQQAMLQQERQRLEKFQADAMRQRAQQQFTQRLEQRINPRIGTRDDSDPQAQAKFITEMMMRMGVDPRMRPQQPGGYSGEGGMRSFPGFTGVRG